MPTTQRREEEDRRRSALADLERAIEAQRLAELKEMRRTVRQAGAQLADGTMQAFLALVTRVVQIDTMPRSPMLMHQACKELSDYAAGMARRAEARATALRRERKGA